MQLYKDFIINHFSLTPNSDNIVLQEMLVKDDYYIWVYCTSVILLRFVSHHSIYDIQAKIIIYNGMITQSEDDIPQILTTSGGIFYKLIKNPIKPFLSPLLNLRQISS